MRLPFRTVTPPARRRVLAVLWLTLAAGCSGDPTGVGEPDPEALAATTQFLSLADSVRLAGADRVYADAYTNIARLIASHGRVTPVRLSVDGMTGDWLAVGRALSLPTRPCNDTAICVAPPDPLVSIVAWQRGNPRRVVQLTSLADSQTLGELRPSFGGGPFMDGASLTYMDGMGGMYVSTSGTQTVRVSDTGLPCAAASVRRPAVTVDLSYHGECTAARMHVSFDATMQPPVRFAPRSNPATGTHVIAMASQDIAGSSIVLTNCHDCYFSGYPAALLPPINPRGTVVLQSTLRATVDSVVTFTLDVVNNTTAPATLEFGNGQQYDFVVLPSGGGTPVWRWSADRMFAMASTARTLAPGEHLIVSERWHPAVRGAYLAQGILTSSSHFAEAITLLNLP